MSRPDATAPRCAQADGSPSRSRTPLRVEVAWATGYGLLCLAVAVAGFLWFLDRLRDL